MLSLLVVMLCASVKHRIPLQNTELCTFVFLILSVLYELECRTYNCLVLLLLTNQKDGVSPEVLLEQVNPCHKYVLCKCVVICKWFW